MAKAAGLPAVRVKITAEAHAALEQAGGPAFVSDARDLGDDHFEVVMSPTTLGGLVSAKDRGESLSDFIVRMCAATNPTDPTVQ